MYMLIRNIRRPRHYLTYDGRGDKSWTTIRLDGTRFNDMREAREGCRDQLLRGARLLQVGRDGETVAYRQAELQVYRKGGTWRFRVGVFDPGIGSYAYYYGRKGKTTATLALAYGKRFIDGISGTPTVMRSDIWLATRP